jgi:hypothetical protein
MYISQDPEGFQEVLKEGGKKNPGRAGILIHM